jgi:hypothetical protein
MPKENLPDENTPQSDSEDKPNRREIAGRVGEFLAYTAPALIALATAKDACAN